MSIETLIIYGSTARDEQHSGSDVDLLGITLDGAHTMIVKKKVNLAVYPFQKMIDMACHGDLFMLHLISEGKAIYDGPGCFDVLNEKFTYRKDYSSDVDNASQLGWSLIDIIESSTSYALINKRIAWCVRTILIAKSAEMRQPVFSSTALAELAKSKAVLKIIENKNNSFFDGDVIKNFSLFLDEFGMRRKNLLNNMTLREYIDHFKKSGNEIALKTLQSIAMLEENLPY